MGGNTLDMTKGSAWKLIVQFAVPVFLSQVFQQLYNTADALIVGRFLGDEALAAVSASGPLIFLLISFFTGLSMGAGVTISRYFGAGDYDRVSRAIHTDVMLGLISGVILTVVGVWLTPMFLRWMGTAPEVLPDAIAYFRYYFIGVLAVVMYNMCKSIMNALGDSKRPLYYLIISSLTNIVLDLLFIGAFHWGVWSAAVATTISQAVSMILCMIHLMKKGTIYQVELKKLHIDREMLGQIIRYGLPSGVQNSIISIANVVVQSNINAFGSDAMAGCGAYSKIEGFVFLPITAFTAAITTFIGQNLGAKEYDRAKRAARFGIFCAMFLAELLGVILYFVSPNCFRLFNDDPAVVAIGVSQMRTECLFFFGLAFAHGVSAVMRGAGRARMPMFTMLACWCILRVTYITFAVRAFPVIETIFRAYPLTWGASCVVFLIYYLKADWVHTFDRREAANAAKAK